MNCKEFIKRIAENPDKKLRFAMLRKNVIGLAGMSMNNTGKPFYFNGNVDVKVEGDTVIIWFEED